MSLLRDEQGGWSSARVGFWVWTVFTIALILLVVTKVVSDPGQAVWSLVGGVFLALIAWAGGPRAMQYLGPRVGEFAKSIADARRKEPDMYRDDERGEYPEREPVGRR